jgi:hypothetical protein
LQREPEAFNELLGTNAEKKEAKMLIRTEHLTNEGRIPSGLLKLYVRYKQDTRAIVAWLVSHGDANTEVDRLSRSKTFQTCSDRPKEGSRAAPDTSLSLP